MTVDYIIFDLFDKTIVLGFIIIDVGRFDETLKSKLKVITFVVPKHFGFTHANLAL